MTESVASGALYVAAAWTTLAVIAGWSSRLPGCLGTLSRRLSDAITPRFVRSALAAVVGLGVAAVPASATDDPLPLLDRVPTAQPAIAVTAAPEAETAPTPRSEADVARPDIHVVQPGDTLWAIAAKHLPLTPSPAAIDRGWREWWQVNRDVIGPNPNLIRPGQELAHPMAGGQQ